MRLTGQGTFGIGGGKWLEQNQVVIKGQLARTHLTNIQHRPSTTAPYYKRIGDTYLRIAQNDPVVTDAGGDPSQYPIDPKLSIRSVFNGEGVEELSKYGPNLAKAAILQKVRFAGIAYTDMPFDNIKDSVHSELMGAVIAGTVTMQAYQDMPFGSLVFLRLPDPNERLNRYPGHDNDAVKLIAAIKLPETVSKMVFDSVRKHIFDMQDTVETRHNRDLRKIDPSRNLYETIGDTAIVFGLEFMKVLIENEIIVVQDTGNDNLFNLREGGGGAVGNGDLLLALGKAFGIIPPSIQVPRGNFNNSLYNAYLRLRKVVIGNAFYDGKEAKFAFNSLYPGASVWSSKRSQQTGPHAVTQAQIDIPRNLVSALEDARCAQSKWVIGTTIAPGRKDSPFRVLLK